MLDALEPLGAGAASPPLSRRLAKRALAALLSSSALILAFLLPELAWRAIRAAGWAGSPRFVEADPELGWRNRRGVALRHRHPDFDVQVELDAAGHRIVPQGAGLGRITFVGDSITFGWGVEARDTFVSRVALALDRRANNLGVPGYGTDQSYLALLNEAPLEPEALVIYTLTDNDLVEVTQRRMYGRAKPRVGLDGLREKPEVGDPLTRWIEERSYLLASTRTWLEARARKPQAEAERSQAVRWVSSLVEKMRHRCERAGAKFLLVVPDHGILAEHPPAGVEEVDLRPAIERANREGRRTTFAKDPHFNATGHALVAGEILAHLRARPASR